MANIKSQIKRNRQTQVRQARNKTVRSEMKTRVKQAVEVASDGTDDAGDRFEAAQKTIDRAVSKGVLHKNTAARKKSRLARRMAKDAD